MSVKMVRHGSSYAVIIPKPIREVLGLSPGSPLNLSTDGKVLVIEPAFRFASKKEFEKALRRSVKKFRGVIKGLAKL